MKDTLDNYIPLVGGSGGVSDSNVSLAWAGILAQTILSALEPHILTLVYKCTIAPVLKSCDGEEMRSWWRYRQLMPHRTVSVFNVLSHFILTTALENQNCHRYPKKQKLRQND